MGENNSDFSTRNNISKGRVMCFDIVFIMITNDIYTKPNVGFGCYDVAPFTNSCNAHESLNTQFEYLWYIG